MKLTKAKLKNLILEYLDDSSTEVNNILFCELRQLAPRRDLINNRQVPVLREDYVISETNPLSIKEIVANWIEGIQPSQDEIHGVMLPLDDVLEYRDFSSHPVNLSIEEMENLKKDLKQVGLTDSIIIDVGKNGQAAISSGNQMLELAKQLNIEEVPVSFVFKDSVQKASKVTAEPAAINKAAEDQEGAVYGQSMQGRGSSLDV